MAASGKRSRGSAWRVRVDMRIFPLPNERRARSYETVVSSRQMLAVGRDPLMVKLDWCWKAPELHPSNLTKAVRAMRDCFPSSVDPDILELKMDPCEHMSDDVLSGLCSRIQLFIRSEPSCHDRMEVKNVSDIIRLIHAKDYEDETVSWKDVIAKSSCVSGTWNALRPGTYQLISLRGVEDCKKSVRDFVESSPRIELEIIASECEEIDSDPKVPRVDDESQ
ncbi:hypothetical protein CYMTET_33375 [Cymbomonas tetramitiformis]|uniref:Uncharacterized protein n=1 Tax=Cymbomonas tetramitiformis TaxID=36881 RepID=A0AAE0FD96_9CHLO|nr:hypothetical protein CYMTET_33375 [Cymbomonas tetramitiformis]